MENARAWLPVIRDFATLTLGASGFSAQLVYWAITARAGHPYLDLTFLCICGFLMNDPERYMRLLIDALLTRLGIKPRPE